MPKSNKDRYLIESIKHRNSQNVMWWKPNKVGYTENVEKAGRYTLEAAQDIVRKSNITGRENSRMWNELEVYDGNAIFKPVTVAMYK